MQKKKKKSGGNRINDVVKGLVDLRILAGRVDCFKVCDDGIHKVVGEPDNVVRICVLEKIEEVKRHSAHGIIVEAKPSLECIALDLGKQPVGVSGGGRGE